MNNVKEVVPNNRQKELEESLRGSYSNSFFHIYVDGQFDPDISHIMEQKDKGTVLHEYVHYIQNIGTLWGLYRSINQYKTLIAFTDAIKSTNEIQRPFKFQLPTDIQREQEYIKHGDGTIGYPKWDIDRKQPVEFEESPIIINGKKQVKVEITFTKTDGTEEMVELGAHIIKESMAALYQSLLDSNAAHDDVPYNLVEILAEQKFPNVAIDKRKLICCCHTSLFSMSPGSSLIEILRKSEKEPSINGMELFDNYVHNKVIITGTRERKKMSDFFDDMLEEFKNRLKKNMVSPLDYIEAALDKVKLKSPVYPFLSLLYENAVFSDDDLTTIIGYYGIPYIQPTKSIPLVPRGSSNDGSASLDVQELIVIEALYKYFVSKENGNPLDSCPLYYMCQGTELEKNECWKKPWDGKNCPFTIFSDHLNLKNKIIK